MSLFILIVLVIFLFYGLRMYKYDKSKYKEESGNSFFSVMMDKGKYGEYLSFNCLEKIRGEHKILTNVYLPKGNGETTEVDLIYIHETGIYVLESKNYSGWIFGDEKSKYWMQTLENKHKEKFYNPIWQNNTHIKYLIKLLNANEKFIKSIIVFSDRCTIKKMEVNSENMRVINRYNLNKTIEKLINNSLKVFEVDKIDELYYELKPYTCISKEGKLKHINEINLIKNSKVENRKSTELKKQNHDNIAELIQNKDVVMNEDKNNIMNEEKNKDNQIYEELDDKNPIYKMLKEYRINRSKEEMIKPYIIFSNSELEELIKKKPKTINELKLIHGFGELKCNKYGEDITKIVKEYCV